MATKQGTGMDTVVSGLQDGSKNSGYRGMGLTLSVQMIDLARLRVAVAGIFN